MIVIDIIDNINAFLFTDSILVGLVGNQFGTIHH